MHYFVPMRSCTRLNVSAIVAKPYNVIPLRAGTADFCETRDCNNGIATLPLRLCFRTIQENS